MNDFDIARMKLDKAVAEANYEAYRIGIKTVLRFLMSILGKDENEEIDIKKEVNGF